MSLLLEKQYNSVKTMPILSKYEKGLYPCACFFGKFLGIGTFYQLKITFNLCICICMKTSSYTTILLLCHWTHLWHTAEYNVIFQSYYLQEVHCFYTLLKKSKCFSIKINLLDFLSSSWWNDQLFPSFASPIILFTIKILQEMQAQWLLLPPY